MDLNLASIINWILHKLELPGVAAAPEAAAEIHSTRTRPGVGSPSFTFNGGGDGGCCTYWLVVL